MIAEVALGLAYLDVGTRVGLALVPIDGTFRSWARGIAITIGWPVVLLREAGRI